MFFGVDYYPEHWDRGEWEKQADLMEQAGFNVVRMGEFAWKVFEREEGKFDFSLLDDAIEILAKHGISTILGTPTAAPPKWLNDNYDILQRDKYGRKKAWGSRRECCANSMDYLEKSRIIVEEMAKHYKDNKNVAAWQIDNEFGCHGSTRCYCSQCRREFSSWLKEKYGTTDNLNKKWGTVFWSLDFDSFDEVILPAYNSCEGTYGDLWSHNPGLDLDYRRFASDSWVKYQKMQIDIIRKYTDVPVTHNMMGHFSDIDYYNLSKDLDFVSWDNYPDSQWGGSDYEYVAMAHEIMRGVKDKNFVVMEEQAGPAGWDHLGRTPKPGQLRLWVYQAVAHGAEGIVYFRFRTALFGMEQYWYGVLDHDGVPRRRYYEIAQTGKELKKLEKYIAGENAKNNYEALLIRSYDNAWAHSIKSHNAGFNYENLLYSYYKANRHFNVDMAVLAAATSPKADVNGADSANYTYHHSDSESGYEKYKAVYMPAYNIVSESEVKNIERYVENGGVLVLTFRSGTRDEYNNVRPLAVPGLFAKLAGIEAEEFDSLRKGSSVDIKGKISGTAQIWCDVIKPVTAEVVCTYDSDYYKDRAAVTVNSYGKGKVFYVGCDLDDKAMDSLVKLVSDAAGIETVCTPYGVEAVKRENCTILLNNTGETVDLSKEEACIGLIGSKALIAGESFDGSIPPYGVEFIEKNS